MVRRHVKIEHNVDPDKVFGVVSMPTAGGNHWPTAKRKRGKSKGGYSGPPHRSGPPHQVVTSDVAAARPQPQPLLGMRVVPAQAAGGPHGQALDRRELGPGDARHLLNRYASLYTQAYIANTF